MENIKINNLTFGYNSNQQIFKQVNLNINSSWRLGLTGRNGQGKSTLFKILLGELDYTGAVETKIKFIKFPLEITNSQILVSDLIAQYIDIDQSWQVDVELTKLGIDNYLADRYYNSLSGGEQTKLMLAILFTIPNGFLLIDEPTNHLDIAARKRVSTYLHAKSGYIIISHDLTFLDEVIDHVVAIERNQIKMYKTKMSVYLDEKNNQDNLEINVNKKLKGEIKRLEIAQKQSKNWSEQKEASKINDVNRDHKPDRGFVGHRAAKMMKRSKSIEKRAKNNLNEKRQLLKNIDVAKAIKIEPLNANGTLILADNIGITIQENQLFTNLNFQIESNKIYHVTGNNGSGKTSLLNILKQKKQPQMGKIEYKSNLIISEISQEKINFNKFLVDYTNMYDLDLTKVSTILINLGVSRDIFNTPIDKWSMGQQKKLSIAHSLVIKAHIYIWDEPLNYLDIIARKQIIDLINKSEMTLIIVEHDNQLSKQLPVININL